MQSKGRVPWCSQWLLPVSRYWYLLTSSLRPQRLSEASVWMYCTWGILLKPRYICGQKGTWSWERVPGPISMLLCSIWVSGSPAQPVSGRLLTYHHRVPCTPEKDIYSFPWVRSMSHSATLPYSSTYFSLKLQYPFTYPKSYYEKFHVLHASFKVIASPPAGLHMTSLWHADIIHSSILAASSQEPGEWVSKTLLCFWGGTEFLYTRWITYTWMWKKNQNFLIKHIIISRLNHVKLI